MYQTIVLGLGFLLLLGGGYLIEHTDKSGVLESAIVGTQNESQAQIAGTYVCDSDINCPNPRQISLSENGDLQLTTTYDGGVETVQESGTWALIKGDILLFTIIRNSQGNYDIPFLLSLKRISPFTLVPSNDVRVTYKDWGSPVFRKQNSEDQ